MGHAGTHLCLYGHMLKASYLAVLGVPRDTIFFESRSFLYKLIHEDLEAEGTQNPSHRIQTDRT